MMIDSGTIMQFYRQVIAVYPVNSSGYWRPPLVPLGSFFEGPADAQDTSFLVAAPDNLQRNGQPAPGEAAWQRECAELK